MRPITTEYSVVCLSVGLSRSWALY